MYSIRSWIFLTNVEKHKSYAMLKLEIISWYRGLNYQSVHINDTFKGYHCMILHPNQQYTNRKCASTYSVTVEVTYDIKAIQTFQFANAL